MKMHGTPAASRPAAWALSFALHVGALAALHLAPAGSPPDDAPDTRAVAQAVMAVQLARAGAPAARLPRPRPQEKRPIQLADLPRRPEPQAAPALPPAVSRPPSPAKRFTEAPPKPRARPHPPVRPSSAPAAASAVLVRLAEPATEDCLPQPRALPSEVRAGNGARDQAAVRNAVPDADNPPPRYPRLARREGYEGLAVLRVRVSADGRCLAAQVARSSGYAILDRAAAEAVRQWRFRPATRGGRTVHSELTIPIRFQLVNELDS
jgi:protein TonB